LGIKEDLVAIVPVQLVWNRVERTREAGVLDFDELLVIGEAIYKTYVAGMVAAVDDDPNRHRYKLTHQIVRADSLGGWDDALAELSTGTSVQHIRAGASDVHQDLTGALGLGRGCTKPPALFIRAFGVCFRCGTTSVQI